MEVATPICHGLEEVAGHLLRLRHAAGLAAEKSGCRIAACGTAPLTCVAPVPVTDTPRYRALHAAAPRWVEEHLINGMHVHVGVPDRTAGLAAMNRLRCWLPVLIGMSANSPFWRGAHGTGAPSAYSDIPSGTHGSGGSSQVTVLASTRSATRARLRSSYAASRKEPSVTPAVCTPSSPLPQTSPTRARTPCGVTRPWLCRCLPHAPRARSGSQRVGGTSYSTPDPTRL